MTILAQALTSEEKHNQVFFALIFAQKILKVIELCLKLLLSWLILEQKQSLFWVFFFRRFFHAEPIILKDLLHIIDISNSLWNIVQRLLKADRAIRKFLCLLASIIFVNTKSKEKFFVRKKLLYLTLLELCVQLHF